jgi:nucleotide-binding universal stress UspA family protein
MNFATILALIDGRPGCEDALKAALRLGKKSGSLVEFLHVERDPEHAMPVLGEGMSGAAVAQLIESMQAAAEARRADAEGLYRRYCTDAGLPEVTSEVPPAPGTHAVRFSQVVGLESDEVTRRGRLSDLIVLARPDDVAGGVETATLEAALFDSGRPVLLIPPGMTDEFGATAALAWDGSREASLAATAALPLLSRAEKVFILTAREEAETAPPSQFAGYLQAHGVDAKTWAFTPGDSGIGNELLAEAKKAGADLLVMGAYGHSRLREMVLGGATRHVISTAKIPVLMVH